MSLLALNLESTPDQQILKEGTEVQFKCIKAEVAESKATPGSFGLKTQHEPQGADAANAPLVFNWQGLPSEGDDERKANNKRRGMIAMCQAHGVDITTITEETAAELFLDSLAWAVVGRKEADGQFPEGNEIKRWVPPKAGA